MCRENLGMKLTLIGMEEFVPITLLKKVNKFNYTGNICAQFRVSEQFAQYELDNSAA